MAKEKKTNVEKTAEQLADVSGQLAAQRCNLASRPKQVLEIVRVCTTNGAS